MNMPTCFDFMLMVESTLIAQFVTAYTQTRARPPVHDIRAYCARIYAQVCLIGTHYAMALLVFVALSGRGSCLACDLLLVCYDEAYQEAAFGG